MMSLEYLTLKKDLIIGSVDLLKHLRKQEFQSIVLIMAIITTPIITKCLPNSKLSTLHTLTHFILLTSPL